MALEVGTDSYVTLAEANTYVQTHFLSTSPARVAWEALSDSDKEVLLRVSCAQIQQLPFTGRAAEYEQTLAFPRLGQDAVPYEVRSAQVENALVMQNSSITTEIEQRQLLQAQGVTEFALGPLREKYGTSSGSAPSLFSIRATSLLKPWLSGGYKIV
jgi:hypothetical protein